MGSPRGQSTPASNKVTRPSSDTSDFVVDNSCDRVSDSVKGPCSDPKADGHSDEVSLDGDQVFVSSVDMSNECSSIVTSLENNANVDTYDVIPASSSNRKHRQEGDSDLSLR